MINLKPAGNDQVVQKLFKDLSEQSPICRQYYTYWDRKDLTLEQSLELSLEGVTEYCYKLMQPIPANLLVFNGEHFDYIKFVNKSDYLLHVKLKELVKYSVEFFEFALEYHTFNTPVQIILTGAEAEKFAKNNNLQQAISKDDRVIK